MDVVSAATAAVSIAKSAADGSADLAAVKQKAVADQAVAQIVRQATQQIVEANKVDVTA